MMLHELTKVLILINIKDKSKMAPNGKIKLLEDTPSKKRKSSRRELVELICYLTGEMKCSEIIKLVYNNNRTKD